jgi:hypothetical protein
VILCSRDAVRSGSEFYSRLSGLTALAARFFRPLGLLVHSRGALELAVEVVLGRIDGDPPADFTVEVEPQEVSSSGGVLINVRAGSCIHFGRTIRDYPPSPAEGLASNERAVALTLVQKH